MGYKLRQKKEANTTYFYLTVPKKICSSLFNEDELEDLDFDFSIKRMQSSVTITYTAKIKESQKERSTPTNKQFYKNQEVLNNE